MSRSTFTFFCLVLALNRLHAQQYEARARGKGYLFMIILFASSLPLFAQGPVEALNKLAIDHQSEKIYIHFDRDYYAAGETIWFKAYLYANGLPSTRSNNFYFQFINSEGTVIAERKYPVKGATVIGDVFLPDSLPQGYYYVRALTPLMVNHSPGFLYDKRIFVFNSTTNVRAATDAPGTFKLAFFPESGQFVGDVLAPVVFQATDSTGNPAEISGIIRTDDGTMIMGFKTTGKGLGKFQFKPQAGRKYVAAVERNGKTDYYPLPEVKSSGIGLKIEDEPNGKMFQVTRSRKNREQYDKLWLIAQMNNLVVFDQELEFESYFSLKGHLLTDSLPTGVLHFTVFDKAGKPLAERLSFVNNREYESGVSLAVLKQGQGPREENIIELSFPGPGQRSCSISITDEDASPKSSGDNIISSLLLTDDLREIENADAYLKNETDSIRLSEFDNRMVMQQWKRFNWNDILAGQFPENHVEDPYLINLTGNLKDTKTNAAVSGGELIVFIDSEDSVNHQFQVPVNSSGNFRIDSLLIFGNSTCSYAYKNSHGQERTVNMTINPDPADSMVTRILYAMMKKYPSAERLPVPAISGRRVITQASTLTATKELDPVLVNSGPTKRPLDQVNEKYTSGAFTTMGRINIDLVTHPENNRSLSVYDYVKRSIRHMSEQKGSFVNTRTHSLFNASTNDWDTKKQNELDSLNGAGGNSPPGSERFIDKGIREKGDYYVIAVYVNESPADINFLKTIRIDNVALIKFFEPGFLGSGMNGPGGTLAIYTKNEVPNTTGMGKLDQISLKGYSRANRFFNPDYSQSQSGDIPADNRVTLYWNPELYTDAEAKTMRIRFYNNDFTRRMRIVVQGFDANGKLISLQKVIGE